MHHEQALTFRRTYSQVAPVPIWQCILAQRLPAAAGPSDSSPAGQGEGSGSDHWVVENAAQIIVTDLFDHRCRGPSDRLTVCTSYDQRRKDIRASSSRHLGKCLIPSLILSPRPCPLAVPLARECYLSFAMLCRTLQRSHPCFFPHPLKFMDSSSR